MSNNDDGRIDGAQLQQLLQTMMQKIQDIESTLTNREKRTESAPGAAADGAAPADVYYPVRQVQPSNYEGLESRPDRDGFSVYAENLFQTVYPEQYVQITQQADFDPAYFSTDINGVPFYTKHMTRHLLTSRRIFWNRKLWSEVPSGSKTRHRQDTERMLAIDDPEYRPRLPKNILQLTNEALYQQLPKNKAATTRQLARVIDKVGVNIARLDPNIRFRTHSLIAPDIRRLIKHPVEGIQELTERVYFNGLVSETDYKVSLIPTIQEFKIVLERALILQLSTDVQHVPAPGAFQPYYQVFVDFVSTDQEGIIIGSSKTLAYEGLGTDFLSLSPERRILLMPTLQQQILQMYGSDSNLHNQIYNLDTTHFIIQRIDLTRSAGNPHDLKLILEFLNNPTKAHTHSSKQLSWCKVITYPSKHNGCFFKLLTEALKHSEGVTKPKPRFKYLDLWKEVDTKLNQKTFGEPITLEYAANAARLYDLYLVVYDIDGKVIYPHPTENYPPAQTLRVLLHNNHYMQIVNYDPGQCTAYKHQHPRWVQPTEGEREKPKQANIDVYYDLETIYSVEPGAETNVRPYSLSYAIDDEEPEFFACEQPSVVTIFDQLLLAITTNFANRVDEWLQLTEGDNSNVYVNARCIAYNGSSFDHLMLFLYLIGSDFHCLEAPSSTGKVRSFKFYLRTIDKVGPQKIKVHLFLSIWDPYLFLHRSLDEAAKAFNLSLSKGKLNHDEVQLAYMHGNLANWLNEHSQQLKEYNEQDVRVLRELVKTFRQTLLTELDCDVFNYSTLPGLCYSYWKDMQYSTGPRGRKIPMHEKVHAVKDPAIDKNIRSAIIGGRVEGFKGIYFDQFHQVDVVSLYPYVMANLAYPVGEEQLLNDPNECAIKFQDPNYIGIYRVKVDQSTGQGYHPILPLRNPETNILDWSWETVRKAGSQEMWLPDVTIKQLLQYGNQVSFSNDQEICGIIWEKSSDGALFGSYVSIFSSIKKREDDNKANGQPFNSVLREVSKMMLNSLSGKMAQRNFEQSTKLWTLDSENELREYLSNHYEDKIPVYSLTSNAVFTCNKKENPYVRPKPSQIGVFIYAYARAYMYDLLFGRMTVYYTDTDSGVITEKDFQTLVNEKRIWSGSGDKPFGMLEDEGAFDIIGVVAPKTYITMTNDGKIKKSRIKGVRDSDLYKGDNGEWLEVGKDRIQLYNMLLTGPVTIRSWQFRKLLKEGRLEHRWIEKTLS